MRHAFLAAAILGLASASVLAGANGTISGSYVEARTAEVFAGGCVMNSEAETMGRQAVMAWKIDQGSYQGVPLDGLVVVAALNGDRNLGMDEMGGMAPQKVEAYFAIDHRANEAQKRALFNLALRMAEPIMGHTTVIYGPRATVSFTDNGDRIEVVAPDIQLTVNKEMKHDPSCGAMQWFTPLSAVDDATIGVAEVHSYSGTALDTRWSHPNKRSAFFGKFTY